ncbi:uncharacterized protein LOC123696928 [Colias croceus]|uniref:uncharacterized protein LOC123696928 n=1 Tax=Colias crocea TaxID=72248 RepID=UPI001E27DCF7|nr:uncharacterized protein LOC123696928 [Colias croceus]
MYRNQRKLYRNLRNDVSYKIKDRNNEVEEVYPPKSKRNYFKMDKPMTNRCCNISPESKDAGLCTETVREQYQNILLEQYGFDPLMSDPLEQIKELKKVLCGSSPKIEHGSQYDPMQDIKPLLAEAECGYEWQDIDNADDIDKFLIMDKEKAYSIQDIEITEIPKLKVIAEKFLKYKKDNIEVRKLEEKIVCLEYEVYKKVNDLETFAKPVQKLRVYFSVKLNEQKDANARIPSSVKVKYKIHNEDLNKMNDKEVEIIDGKISDNRPYLEDLKKILNRKQAIFEKKRKTKLDLNSLYEMAKRDVIALDGEYSNTNFLSRGELEEIKDLIKNKCASSIHGISRRTLKSGKEDDVKREKAIDVISESIFTELLRNIEK